MIILDHDLKVIRVNRTIELWGWGDVNEVNGIHVLNLIKPAIEHDSINDWISEWCQVDIQKNVEWESKNFITSQMYGFSFYPIRDIDSCHHDDNCYAVLLIRDITNNKTERLTKPIIERRKDNLVESDTQNNLIEETENRLHQLAEQLINSQEYERKRVSSELHDGVGQVLAALKYQVEY
jgi:signal transduction histidine kinase